MLSCRSIVLPTSDAEGSTDRANNSNRKVFLPSRVYSRAFFVVVQLQLYLQGERGKVEGGRKRIVQYRRAANACNKYEEPVYHVRDETSELESMLHLLPHSVVITILGCS